MYQGSRKHWECETVHVSRRRIVGLDMPVLFVVGTDETGCDGPCAAQLTLPAPTGRAPGACGERQPLRHRRPVGTHGQLAQRVSRQVTRSHPELMPDGAPGASENHSRTRHNATPTQEPRAETARSHTYTKEPRDTKRLVMALADARCWSSITCASEVRPDSRISHPRHRGSANRLPHRGGRASACAG